MSITLSSADASGLPTVLNVTLAATILDIGRSKAYEAVATGTWPTRVIRIGRCIRIPTTEVLRLIGVDQMAADARAA
jgi:hypothetical protein